LDPLSVAGLVVSGGALGVAGISALFARKQLQLAERLRARDFEATVVAEMHEIQALDTGTKYTLKVTNAGPAVARDVSIYLTVWTDETPLSRIIDSANVAPALLRGEQRLATIELPSDEARFDDRSRSTEIDTAYYDDNGVRNERLAFVFEDSLVLTPPQPPPERVPGPVTIARWP
jgi:hypothetical protein